MQHLEKPPWLKVKAPLSSEYQETHALVETHKLHTVCKEAHCPNIGECWSKRSATFLIMGDLCTRSCRFCAVKKGTPRPGRENSLRPLDPGEPERVALAVKALDLKHAVITSVNRDDQPDNGAAHFAATVKAIKQYAPLCKIELLIPDLQGSRLDLQTIMQSGPDVLNHNLETVPRLYKAVRPKAGYIRSLSILKWAKELNPSALTKSGIMVGLGETKEEVLALMDDLLYSGVEIMTIGQYLRPSLRQLPVKSFVRPEEFKEYEKIGRKKGFKFVESGPLVRSSYQAWKHTQPAF